MKYFAKYLPVEGEIKKQIGGMKVFDQKGILQHIAADVSKTLLPNLNKICKKAQLFLCSRDIQIGDDIKLGSESGTNAHIHDEISLQYYKGLGGHKVIGPISPEATWVKEGDEFGEGDVMAEYHISLLPPNNDMIVGKSYYDLVYDPKKRTIYLIKGPCGHFH